MSKKQWSMVALLVAAIGVGVVVAATRDAVEPSNVQIAEIHALPSGAVVLWSNPHRIGRVDANGGLVWRRELPGKPPYRDAIAVADDLVVVRYWTYEDPHVNRAIAYSLDGKQRWDQRLSGWQSDGHASAPPTAPYFTPSIANGVYTEVIDEGERWSIVSLDTRTGAVLSKTPTELLLDSFEPGRTGGLARFRAGMDAHWYDPRAGSKPIVAERSGSGCFIDGAYVSFDLATRRLISTTSPTAHRVIADPFIVRGDRAGYVRLLECGRYRDHDVLLLEHSNFRSGSDDARKTLVVVLDSQGNQLHSIVLGAEFFLSGSYAKSYPGTGSFQGELPRFVPLAYRDRDSSGPRLVLLDLEKGSIAWRSPPGRTLHDIYRRGSRWYLVQDGLPQVITTIDGTTGELERSMIVHNYEGTTAASPVVTSDDSIWISTRGARGSLATVPLAILDARTLEQRVVRGPRWTFEDQTDEMRRWIGLAK